MEEERDYSGRPLRPPDKILKNPARRGGKLVPPSFTGFHLPDGRIAAMHDDRHAYVLDDDGAFDFDQPAEVPEFMRGSW